MLKLNQKGIVHFLLPLILIIGLIAGVYLVTSGNPLKLFSKASMSKPTGPETSLTLVGPNECAGLECLFPKPQEEFNVKLYARSDIEQANLFTAKITFPKDLVEVVEIKLEDKFNEVENYYDNNTGEISVVGGVAAPGYQTQQNGPSALMATITFKAKALGKGVISFTDDSAIYSNLNNINILTIKRNYDVSVEVAPPSPIPSSTPIAGPCDGKSYFDVPTQGETLTAGTTVALAGWGTFCSGPNGTNRDRVDIHKCDQGTWTNCSQINGNPPFVSSVARPDVVAATWTCGNLNPNDDGWDYKWVVPNTPGNFTLREATINNSATTCVSWSEKNITITPTPTGTKGDGNKDGKINLIDMSVLHTDYRKTSDMTGFRDGIDMNNDKLINALDFALLMNKLAELGVIKRR